MTVAVVKTETSKTTSVSRKSKKKSERRIRERLKNGLYVDVLLRSGEIDAKTVRKQLTGMWVGTPKAPQTLQWKGALCVRIEPLASDHPARELGRLTEYHVQGLLCTGINVEVCSTVSFAEALHQLQEQAKHKKVRVNRFQYKWLK